MFYFMFVSLRRVLFYGGKVAVMFRKIGPLSRLLGCVVHCVALSAQYALHYPVSADEGME